MTVENLIDLNNRREEDSTVITLNRFSKKLMGFLSIETEGEHFRFTDRKELLWAVPEVQAKEMKKLISEGDEFLISIKNEDTENEEHLSSHFLRFEVAKIQYQK